MDVTGHRSAVESEKAARLAAEKANQAKSQFVANVTHELRTPLQVILATLDGSIGDLAPPRVLEAASQQLLHLVDQLLDMHSLETGRVKIRQRVFDPRLVLEEVAGAARRLVGVRSLDIRAKSSRTLPNFCKSDPGLLRQVLINLVSNAIKFTPSGAITIRLGYLARHQFLTACIVDSGPGISADQLSSLFGARGEPTRRDWRADGHGLGLPIARSIVDQLGGKLRVRSLPGIGTAFRLRIPVEQSDVQDSRKEVGPSSLCMAGLSVLVADDNSIGRALVREMLRPLGATIIEAPDGQHALDILMEGTVHLAIVDLHMPRLHGISVAREYLLASRRDKQERAWLVALTANPFERDRALAAGFDQVLTRPITREDLLDCLRQFISPDG